MKTRPLICPRCESDLSPAKRGNAYECPRCGLNVVLDFSHVENMSESERIALLERDKARAERDKARFECNREKAERDKAYAPLEVEMQKNQLEHEREKERNDNRVMLAMLGLLVALLLFCLLMLSAPRIAAFFTGDIAVPASSGDLSGISYFDAEQRFKDAGFTNTECIDLNDLDFVNSLIIREDSVDYITINGEERFDSDAYYPSDAIIRIYYHSHPD